MITQHYLKKGFIKIFIDKPEVTLIQDALRGGLASLGVSSGDKVAIICKNTEEWAVSAYATYGLCGQHIPMYETQMPSEWEYIIRDCGAKVLLAANSSIFEKTRNFPDQIDSLEHVILLTGSVEGEVTTYEDLLKKGREKPVQKMEPESHAPMGDVDFLKKVKKLVLGNKMSATVKALNITILYPESTFTFCKYNWPN